MTCETSRRAPDVLCVSTSGARLDIRREASGSLGNDHQLDGRAFLRQHLSVGLQFEVWLVLHGQMALQDAAIGDRKERKKRPGQVRAVDLVVLLGVRLLEN